jgi:CrcB protein
MMNILLVGLGGFLGAIARYLLGLAVSGLLPNERFPFGVLLANLSGSYLIGLLWGIFSNNPNIDEKFTLFLIVGVLGGFTTFSSFSLDNLKLIIDGQILQAIMNMSLSLFGGILLAYLGFQSSKII